MASWKPEIYSADEVMAYYSSNEAVTFRVYAGTKPDPAYLRYAFEETDKGMKHEGEAILSAALHKILTNPQNTNPYLLEIVRGQGKGRKLVTTNITFQLNQIPAFGSVIPSDPMMRELMEQQKVILSLLVAKKQDEEDEAGNEMGEIEKHPLIKLLERPEITGVLAQGVAKFVGKIINVGDQESTPVLNGVSDQDLKIKEAVSILKEYDELIGDHLLKLATLAQTNPAYFNQLITMLKMM